MYKIAIAGASTLLGRELKEALSDSPLAAASFVLLDEEQAQGQLDRVGDEITFVQAIGADAFERADFTFFAGTEDLTRKHWREALRAGSTVLDLSGALDQETGVLVRAPWLGSEAATADLFTPAVVPAHPAALALALVLERLQLAADGRASHEFTAVVPAAGADVRRHFACLGRRAGAGSGAAATGRRGAVCGRHGAGAGQRIWPCGNGRAAPADGEPAELPGLAAGHLRRADSL